VLCVVETRVTGSMLIVVVPNALLTSVTLISSRGFSSLIATGGAVVTWLWWVLLFFLVLSAVWSAWYLNKAMMYFGNSRVVPVNYCSQTLAVVAGSAIVYNEFAGITPLGVVGFAVGCIGAFAGVYIISSGREDEFEPIDEEDVTTELVLKRYSSVQLTTTGSVAGALAMHPHLMLRATLSKSSLASLVRGTVAFSAAGKKMSLSREPDLERSKSLPTKGAPMH